jgi:hypothetical protein
VQHDFAPIGADRPGAQNAFLATSLLPQRLIDGIQKQVLHLKARQVPFREGLILVPQYLGDLADRGAAQQPVARRFFQRILDISGRQAAGVHLHGQSFQDVAVAPQEGHQLGTIGLWRVAYLRHLHHDFSFRGANAPRHIAIAIATMLLLWPAALIVVAFQIIGHFLLHHLLNHALNAQTDDQAGHIRFSIQALLQQLFRLLANLLTWWYPMHGVRVSFLLFGRQGPYQEHYTSRRFLFTELY